ncbi:lactoylglutathione lyase [Kosmotoga arenicorallina S304]|uniref:Lactoylglutathione lyase n=1 Tax=Kosmotoga arenicorallina S304 TaxID=1453497 RepID=A0A176K205_9BACT|nr:methylmalonyl-CoA epimerase [Kosmotoga arenicorallina]OAA31053.1 lactoylglutathione lyase [Kosmotoga arenicorallina S304]
MRTDRVDHIGIVVRSIEEKLDFYRSFLGLELHGIEELSERGLKVAFLKVGDTRIELLEPIRSDSEISRFLEKRGEGIHHIAYHVDNIAEAIEKAISMGFQPLSKEPSIGAGGVKIVFLHPKTTGGVLVELVEGKH